jgi:serine O-acetyltransferase
VEADAEKFAPYGTPLGDLPDPVARALDGLMDQVTTLKARVEELERRRDEFQGVSLDYATENRIETPGNKE